MGSKPRHAFDPLLNQNLLRMLRTCRDASTDASGKVPIGGELYQRLDRLRGAIDDIAEIITGDRQHFWLKAHSSHNPPPVSCPRRRDSGWECSEHHGEARGHIVPARQKPCKTEGVPCTRPGCRARTEPTNTKTT